MLTLFLPKLSPNPSNVWPTIPSDRNCAQIQPIPWLSLQTILDMQLENLFWSFQRGHDHHKHPKYQEDLQGKFQSFWKRLQYVPESSFATKSGLWEIIDKQIQDKLRMILGWYLNRSRMGKISWFGIGNFWQAASCLSNKIRFTEGFWKLIVWAHDFIN